MDYKTTLLMNKSNFEMRGNLNQKEPVLVKKWEEQKVYENMNLNRKDAIEFILHDGNKVEAKTRFTMFNGYAPIDLGIAKCHFEIGAGKECFEWM